MYESETCCFVQFGWFGAHSVSSVHIRCTFERFQIESGVNNDGGSGWLKSCQKKTNLVRDISRGGLGVSSLTSKENCFDISLTGCYGVRVLSA